jgi:hypothetical protein
MEIVRWARALLDKLIEVYRCWIVLVFGCLTSFLILLYE